MRRIMTILVLVGVSTPSALPEPTPDTKESVLFDFEDDGALRAWSNLAMAEAKEPAVKLELSDQHVTSAKRSLKLTFAGGHFPTITAASTIKDWTRFKTFKADVTANRQGIVVFRALHQESTRGSSYNEGVNRWEHAALLSAGKNQVVALSPSGPKYAQVTTFEIFLIDPRPGDTLFIDNIRLSPEAPAATTPLHIDYVYSPGQDHAYWPKLDRKIQVLSTDLEVANANDLGDRLKERWVKPEDRSVEQVEAEIAAQYTDLKKKHPTTVLAVFRDGAPGYDPAAPDNVYSGWKDCGTTAHPPASLTVASMKNIGKAESMEAALRLRPALMKIDLTSIPAGSKVLSARLLLLRSKPLGKDWDAKPTMLVAEACNRPWEGFEMDSFHFAKNQFWKEAWGMSWNGPDPDFLPLFLAHGPSQGMANTWDFTAAVDYWTAGKHANHGFCLYAAQKYLDFL